MNYFQNLAKLLNNDLEKDHIAVSNTTYQVSTDNGKILLIKYPAYSTGVGPSIHVMGSSSNF